MYKQYVKLYWLIQFQDFQHKILDFVLFFFIALGNIGSKIQLPIKATEWLFSKMQWNTIESYVSCRILVESGHFILLIIKFTFWGEIFLIFLITQNMYQILYICFSVVKGFQFIYTQNKFGETLIPHKMKYGSQRVIQTFLIILLVVRRPNRNFNWLANIEIFYLLLKFC